MKKVFLLLLIFGLLHSVSKAQSTAIKSSKVYWFVSLGGALPFAARGAVEMVTAKGLSCSIFGFGSSRISPDTPFDYNGLDIWGSGSAVEDNLSMFGFTAGKAGWLSGSSRTRFNLKGGVAFGSFNYPINFRRSTSFSNFFNYDYDRAKQQTVGLVLQSTLEFALSRYFGLSLSLYGNINKSRSMAGIETAIMIGHLRDKRPRQK